MFDSQEFHQQFVLAKRRLRPLSGFHQYKVGEWELAVHPSLPVSRLVDSSGVELGWAVGDIFGPGRDGPGEDIVLSGSDDNHPTYFGRYVIIRINGGKGRLYPDSCASLGAVYSKTHQLAASTVTIGMMAAGVPDGWEPGIDVLKPGQYLPCGLTASSAFQRLLPNHYCDLDTWTSIRAPSRSEGVDGAPSLSRSLDGASSALVDYIGQIVQRYPGVYLPLTAGNDSRAIAAAAIAGGYAKSIECFTFSREGSTDTSDQDSAAAIARMFDLPHRILKVARVDDKVKRDYQRRTGFSGHWGKAQDFHVACLKNLDMSAAWLPGFHGGRANLWKKEPLKLANVIPSADELLSRLELPQLEDFRTASAKWLAALPPGSSRWTILDRAFLEMRIGCWASPHLYGSAPFRAQFFPLCHPSVQDAASALPDAYRKLALFHKHLIATLVPSLLKFPFNSRSGSESWRQKLLRYFVANPHAWPILSSYRRLVRGI